MASGQQGGNDLKRWVLGGGTNEDDGTCLDIGQKGVLLRFIEAVNLIDKNDGIAIFPPVNLLRPSHQYLDVTDFAHNRAQCAKGMARRRLDTFGERCFAGSGWAVKNCVERFKLY